ncbi:MAG: peptide-methionine (S)-S-oxide reductase MsrA [Methanospirillum sp.]|uniref:peptide-methionine (S)-S-oxide reductase MsrA n=1 Tax=Methanospirillum sp. TaxID=45200 RepID=UPI0023725B17|nr:peptide-methionine (S)-S-oxide reductase MsrA [Methanospirillum sp.]MDD1729226.1 peptide-methionine (S)-S-oxide reductase MsrA [Methanospirillum sp.]
MAIATFAAGCFWGVEAAFQQVPGVLATRVGYTGGSMPDPTYQDVCSDKTGHAEAVQLEYDPDQVSYRQLLEVFFQFHNPTELNRQGPDEGTQYRSVIFYESEAEREQAIRMIERIDASGKYSSPVVTAVVPSAEFWPAEEYHQSYYLKIGRRYSGL